MPTMHSRRAGSEAMPASGARTKKHRRQNGQKASALDSPHTSAAARALQILLFFGCIMLAWWYGRYGAAAGMGLGGGGGGSGGSGGGKPPKICVYSIALNEVKNVDAFMDHCQGADVISVADTGSTDGTIEALQARGAAVHNVTLKPFRFDKARNAALAKLPSDCDLCVGIDLDDQPQPGWLEALRDMWAKSWHKPAAVRYRYVWRFEPDSVTPAGEFMITKVHSRRNWRWNHPAHEALDWTGPGQPHIATLNDMVVHHRPANEQKECRGSCRANYIKLLKLGVEEDPADSRRSYYYGRELYFDGQWEQAIVELERYLTLPSAQWREERAAAARHISDCHTKLGRHAEAQAAAQRGVAEWDGTSEPWVALARTAWRAQDHKTCRRAAERALALAPSLAFASEAAHWELEAHDNLALCAYYLGDKETALRHGAKAAELAPDDKRLQENLQWYRGDKQAGTAGSDASGSSGDGGSGSQGGQSSAGS
ncbi:hypothetical protein ABPG75_011701 [Micractinium tetrahymenae]